MKTDFVPFVLGRFIFPGIKKKKATTFTIMGSWEERKSKWNRDSILLFEYLKKKNNNSKTLSYFAKFKKKKKNLVFEQGNQCEKLRSATLNISGEFITEEMLPLCSCVHGWRISFN